MPITIRQIHELVQANWKRKALARLSGSGLSNLAAFCTKHSRDPEHDNRELNPEEVDELVQLIVDRHQRRDAAFFLDHYPDNQTDIVYIHLAVELARDGNVAINEDNERILVPYPTNRLYSNADLLHWQLAGIETIDLVTEARAKVGPYAGQPSEWLQIDGYFINFAQAQQDMRYRRRLWEHLKGNISAGIVWRLNILYWHGERAKTIQAEEVDDDTIMLPSGELFSLQEIEHSVEQRHAFFEYLCHEETDAAVVEYLRRYQGAALNRLAFAEYRQYGRDSVPRVFINDQFGYAFVNEQSVINMNGFSDIDPANIFVTEEAPHYFFDVVEDLAPAILEQHTFINPYTRLAFSEEDIKRLTQFPVVQRAISQIMQIYANTLVFISRVVSPETLQRLYAVATVLDGSGTALRMATRHFAHFRAYVSVLSEAEQAAIMTLKARGRNRFTGEHWVGSLQVLVGELETTCSHQIGSIMQGIPEEVMTGELSTERYSFFFELMSHPEATVGRLQRLASTYEVAANIRCNCQQMQKRPLVDYIEAQAWPDDTLALVAQLPPQYLTITALPALVDYVVSHDAVTWEGAVETINTHVAVLPLTDIVADSVGTMTRETGTVSEWLSDFSSALKGQANALASIDPGYIAWQLAFGEDLVYMRRFIGLSAGDHWVQTSKTYYDNLELEQLNVALCITDDASRTLLAKETLSGLRGRHPTNRSQLKARALTRDDINLPFLNQMIQLQRYAAHNGTNLMTREQFIGLLKQISNHKPCLITQYDSCSEAMLDQLFQPAAAAEPIAVEPEEVMAAPMTATGFWGCLQILHAGVNTVAAGEREALLRRARYKEDKHAGVSNPIRQLKHSVWQRLVHELEVETVDAPEHGLHA